MQLSATKKGVIEHGADEARLRRGSPVVSEAAPFLIALIAGLVCYGLFFRRGAWLSVIGFSVAPAERILYGEAPYRDFLYNYTPGILWLNALLMKTFGATLLTIRSGLLVFKLLTILALFYAGRRLTSGWAALVPVGLTLAWIGYKYIFGIFPTQYSMLFVLLGLVAMLRFDETGKTGWLLLSGILIGIVFVFKYNVGILLAVTGAAAVAIREVALSSSDGSRLDRLKPALKRCAIYWAGFAIVAGAMALYLASQNALGAMIDHFLHHVLEYGDKRAIPLPPLKHLGPALLFIFLASAAALTLLLKAPRLYERFLIFLMIAACAAVLFPGRGYYVKLSASAFVAYLPIFLFLFVAALLAAGFRIESRRGAGLGRWWSRHGILAILGLIGLGAFLEVYPRADFYHIVRSLPPIFLLLTVLLYRSLPVIESILSNHVSKARRAALLSAAVPLALIAATGVKDAWQPHFDSQLRFVERTPISIEKAGGVLVNRKQARMIEELAGAINENSSPDDPIFSFAQKGAGFYFLTGRRNPTRFVWWRSVGIKEEDRAAVMEMIANRKLKLILLQDMLKDRRVREAVTNNYDLVRKVADIGVYSRREQ